MNDDYRGRTDPIIRNLTRRQRRLARQGKSKPAGITIPCGCRYTRTGGAWRHITPCSTHQLRPAPLDDQEMRALA